jgi:polyferredoxin
MVAMAKGKSGSGIRALVRWRWLVQAGFVFVWLNPFFLRLHTVCSPVFHCYSCPLATFACPIGVLANFSALHLFPFIAAGTLLAVGALFGSLVCGWACPFGYLQDLLAKVPTPKYRVPAWTGFIRYAVLGLFVLAIPFFFGEGSPLFFCRLCPAGALEAALPYSASLAIAGQEIVWPSAAKLAILGAVGLAMLFVWRPWCTLFCPLGAIFGLCNRIAFFYVDFREGDCDDCGICHKLCHYAGRNEQRAGESRCIRCLECVGCRALRVGSAFGRSDTKPRISRGNDLLTVDGVVTTGSAEERSNVSAGG